MADARRPEVVRTEIAFERAELARALDELRTEVSVVKGRVGSKLKMIVGVVAGALVLFAALRKLLR